MNEAATTSPAGKLARESRFADPDAAFRLLAQAHRDLDERASATLNARLVLILANQIGEEQVLREAVALAREAKLGSAHDASGALRPMEDLPTFYSTLIPLGFFFWGPALVVLTLLLSWLWARSLKVDRALESDFDGFTKADVEKLFSLYGPERRAIYRNKLLPADLAFALVYTVVGALIITGLSMRGYPWWVAALCGGGWLFGGLCDIVENLAIARLLDRFPTLDDGTVAIASGFTRLKLVLTGLGFIGAIAAYYLAFKPIAA